MNSYYTDKHTWGYSCYNSGSGMQKQCPSGKSSADLLDLMLTLSANRQFNFRFLMVFGVSHCFLNFSKLRNSETQKLRSLKYMQQLGQQFN